MNRIASLIATLWLALFMSTADGVPSITSDAKQVALLTSSSSSPALTIETPRGGGFKNKNKQEEEEDDMEIEEEDDEDDSALEASSSNDMMGIVLDTAFDLSHRTMILCGKMTVQVYFALKRAVHAGLHPEDYELEEDEEQDDDNSNLVSELEDATDGETPLQTKVLRVTVRLAKLTAKCLQRMAKAAITLPEHDESIETSYQTVEQTTDKFFETTSMLSSKLYKLKTKFQKAKEDKEEELAEMYDDEDLYDEDEYDEEEEEEEEELPVVVKKAKAKSNKKEIAEVIVDVFQVEEPDATEEQQPQVTVEVVTNTSPSSGALAVNGGHQKKSGNRVTRFFRNHERVFSGMAIGICSVLLWESALKSGRLSEFAQVAGTTTLQQWSKAKQSSMSASRHLLKSYQERRNNKRD
jgi:hypothetical protein